LRDPLGSSRRAGSMRFYNIPVSSGDNTRSRTVSLVREQLRCCGGQFHSYRAPLHMAVPLSCKGGLPLGSRRIHAVAGAHEYFVNMGG
jgi:hypothetical protein